MQEFHKNRSDLRAALTLTLALGFMASCSNLPKTPLPQSGDSADAELAKKSKNSSLEIEYLLERDRYRLFFQSQGDRVSIESYHDGKIIEKGEIDSTKYSLFLKKAMEAIKTFKNESNGSPPCLSPFVVTLKFEKKAEQVRGCRSRDHGSLSKLIREGEFLLYSKNG